MFPSFLEALEGSEHEQVQLLQDSEIGLSAILAIHSTRHGPAFGGVRRFEYRDPEDALGDALRLSRAMSFKCVMAGVPGGGGKCVVLDHPRLDKAAAYRLLGRYIHNMGGRFYTGPDVGTGPTELACLAESTSFVTRPGSEGPGDLQEATARGVLAGLRAVIGFLRGKQENCDLGDARFAIQGMGGVGLRLARSLAASGADLFVADEDAEKVNQAAEELGAEVVDPGAVFDAECDVFVPCAMGGILHDLTIERLRCRAVAGAANNILAAPEHASSLAARGILVAPDYVINSGALILGANFHLGGRRDNDAAIDRIGDELYTLFQRAEREDLPPPELADQIALARLREPPHECYFPE